MTNKSNTAELEERISKVFYLLIAGATKQQINKYVEEKTTWGVTDRQVRNYISEANKRIIKASKTRQKRELGKALLRLDQLYFLSLNLQNLQNALAVQKEINELIGLKIYRQEISGKDGTPLIDGAKMAKALLDQLNADRNAGNTS